MLLFDQRDAASQMTNQTGALPLMPLLQSVLQHYEWMGILTARLVVGILFAVSGGGKLFVPSRRDEMLRTLRAAGIPAPKVNAVFVSLVEFVCGILLVLGLLTPLSCLLLCGDMVVALGTSVLPRIKASSLAEWLGAVLYLPEVLYLVILVWLLLSGPGWFSVDYWLWS
jgi:putative oxidoreductase